jgi:hypothetical protein
MVVRAGQRSSPRFRVLRDTPAGRPRPDARRARHAHQVEASVQKARGQPARRHRSVDPARRHRRPNVEAEMLASIFGTRHRYSQATARCRTGAQPLGHLREKFEPPTCGQPQPNHAPTPVCPMTGFSPQPNQGRRGPRQRGTVGGDGSRSPTNPGRSRSIPATRTVSGPGELRFLVRPEDAG